MPLSPSPALALRRLVALKDQFGPGAEAAKLRALSDLRGASLRTPAQVLALHEVLCFWRAYPDSPRLLKMIEAWLAAFSRREDLRRVRGRLLSSGVAGTDTVYEFKFLTAAWLARRWPARLTIEWPRVADEDLLTQALIPLALPAEVPGLDEAPAPPRAWLTALEGPGGDAAWIASRVASLPAPELVRDRYYESLHLPCRLASGEDVPSRTIARAAPGVMAFQRVPLRRERPDLLEAAQREPVRVHEVAREEAERLLDLARTSMITRQRDLDAFVWADPGDVRVFEWEDGLRFACIGSVPSRRFLLECMYGFLTLKNGVPIGYALASGLMQFVEVAYNVFETFRGGEAARVYGRLLATVRWLFDARELTIHPYQLGDGNDEGLDSGAWWFYYKLGFRPRAQRAKTLVARETARIDRDPAYRTPRRTLERLVRDRLYLTLGPKPAGVPVEALRLDRIGRAVTAHVNARFGGDRERAAADLADEAGARLEVREWRRLPKGERVAWERWAPLVSVLPDVAAWPKADRAALADVIRAKGGRHESDYVALFDAHTRLRAAVVAVSRAAHP